MGGQACVFYGAAEFSRDTDFSILSDQQNLQSLREALADLQAVNIALPPFEPHFLLRGHAIHFRCQRADVRDMRIDVMAKMRGVDDFAALWERRTTVNDGSLQFEVMSLPDLVNAKKTQRDKDWPMIRRLVDTDYLSQRSDATARQIQFWFRELRSPLLLVELAARATPDAATLNSRRSTLLAAVAGDLAQVEAELQKEESAERAADRLYWEPLRAELQELRRQRLSSRGPET